MQGHQPSRSHTIGYWMATLSKLMFAQIASMSGYEKRWQRMGCPFRAWQFFVSPLRTAMDSKRLVGTIIITILKRTNTFVSPILPYGKGYLSTQAFGPSDGWQHGLSLCREKQIDELGIGVRIVDMQLVQVLFVRSVEELCAAHKCHH